MMVISLFWHQYIMVTHYHPSATTFISIQYSLCNSFRQGLIKTFITVLQHFTQVNWLYFCCCISVRCFLSFLPPFRIRWFSLILAFKRCHQCGFLGGQLNTIRILTKPILFLLVKVIIRFFCLAGYI